MLTEWLCMACCTIYCYFIAPELSLSRSPTTLLLSTSMLPPETLVGDKISFYIGKQASNSENKYLKELMAVYRYLFKTYLVTLRRTTFMFFLLRALLVFTA